MIIYSCDGKAEFSAVFSVTRSLKNILICWFAAQETFLGILTNVEIVVMLNVFCGNW